MNELEISVDDVADFLPESYDFVLPENQIAQKPTQDREDARLLVLGRGTGLRAHRRIRELPELLRGDEVVVVNDTRVVPARLLGRRSTGGKVELLVLPDRLSLTGPHEQQNPTCRCISKSSRALKAGEELYFGEKDVVVVKHVVGQGIVVVDFTASGGPFSLMERVGHVPLPPYIRRVYEQSTGSGEQTADQDRYQTVYATHPGAVAAPTAGLHLTNEILGKLKNQDIPVVRITLHVGPGTFLPIRVSNLHDHSVLPEFALISPEASAYLNDAQQSGRRILAVGTTTVRTLESFSDDRGRIQSGARDVMLTIRPGYRFRVTQALLTNFHLPKSSLLVLVSTFAGRASIMDAYRDAVSHGYRFYSYGDAMLIGDYGNL